MHSYVRPLLERIEMNKVDPLRIISHRITLEEVPDVYKVSRDKREGAIQEGRGRHLR